MRDIGENMNIKEIERRNIEGKKRVEVREKVREDKSKDRMIEKIVGNISIEKRIK